MQTRVTNGGIDDPGSLALAALAWVLADDDRAQRLLALTGLTPDTLRATLSETWLQNAILRFLEAHEPDLIACAEAIGRAPGDLVAARRSLDG